MIKRVQIIGHTVTPANAFLGRAREVTVNTTANAMRVHDGATVGGFEQARQDMSNVPAATAVIDGKMTAAQAADLAASKTSIDAHIGNTTGHPIVTSGDDGFMAAADKVKLDGIEALATGDQSGAEILAALLPVDGSGSGLDADLLDGLNGAVAGTASTVMTRDANGRSQVVSPNVASDIATKGYVDTQITSNVQIPTGGAVTMLFFQAAAPSGWTQDTSHNNKALRIVSAAGGGSGGGVPFDVLFGTGQVTGAHTLVESEMPAHTHPITGTFFGSPGDGLSAAGTGSFNYVDPTGASAGGDGSHTHTLTNLDLQFVDIIFATKD